MRPVSRSSSEASNPSPRPCAFEGLLGVQIILRRRSVGCIHAMAIDEAAVDHPAMTRDEESDVGPQASRAR
jgi:hypothetical protein